MYANLAKLMPSRNQPAMTGRSGLAHVKGGTVYLLRGDISITIEQYQASIALNAMLPESFNILESCW